MARTNRSGEVLAQVSRVEIIRDKSGGAANALAAATAAGASTFTLSSGAGFAASQLVRLGSENELELCHLTGVAGAVLTPRYPTHFDQPAAAVCVETERVKIGEATDEGVQFSGFEGDFQAIMAATRRMVYTYLPGHHAPMISFGLLNFNLENLLMSLGMNEATRIQTNSTRSRTVLDPSRFNELRDISFAFHAVRKDGKNIEVQAWGCEIDPTAAAQFTMAMGERSPLPFTVRPTAAMQVEIF